VILRTPPEGKRYEVRRFDTGKVLARGDAEHEALAVTGNLFLRENGEGVLSATDVTSSASARPAPRTTRSTGSRCPTGV
jgi:hypothetical protein